MLSDVLSEIDWNQCQQEFLREVANPNKIDNSIVKIAHWARIFETQFERNLALSFVREMQNSMHCAAACVALGLYKSAASGIRSALESALYFSYFHSHPTELNTLLNNEKYYLSKSEIIAFHKIHTPHFNKNENLLGLCSRLEKWYAEISSIVHAQIPGAWSTFSSLRNLKYHKKTNDESIKKIEECCQIINDLNLCCFAEDYWNEINPDVRTIFTYGLKLDVKAALGLSKI